MRAELAAGNALARIARAFRLVMDKSLSPCNRRFFKESGSLDQVNSLGLSEEFEKFVNNGK